MSMLIKYIFTFGFVSVMVIISSIIWPRFTKKDRPKPLTKIYDAVSKTKSGIELGKVLGVASDSAQIQPFNISDSLEIIGNDVLKLAEKQARRAITRHAIIQLKLQFDKLSKDEKAEIQKSICAESTSSSDISD